ncbi:MAG TPA: site-2 protease family protein [Tepidisphaeraceae bacterium]|nr:site-2 protease family protein [Tepidisphaeraceae bacterium]
MQTDPRLYFAIVITVVVSIVLHELAHGWMAMYLGDDTPRVSGHMTGNPVVHMGWFSLFMLFVVGIAWGQMPVDPTRMRGKRAGALVALAGPAMNVVLALVSTLILGVWMRLTGPGEVSQATENLHVLLKVFGLMNIALALFNLLPVPPLDGSRIVADFVPAYREFLFSDRGQFAAFGLFILLFLFGGRLIFSVAAGIHTKMLGLIGV